MATKKQNAGKPAEHKNTLSIKQQLFLQYYTDNTSDTYSNITRSYMKAYGTTNTNSAGVAGFNLLRTNKIQTEYERLCEQYGIGAKVRFNALSDIVHGNYKQETSKSIYSKDKETGRMVLVGQTKEQKTPTARERLTGIQLIERISLEHQKAGLKQIHELSKNAKQVFSSLKDVTPAEDEDALLQIALDEID